MMMMLIFFIKVLFSNEDLSKFYILKINMKYFALIFYISGYVNSYSYIDDNTQG